MTTTPEATKGVPRVEGDPAPTLRADHNALADWVRDRVGESISTVAALPSTGNWEGRAAWVEETQGLYVWDESWLLVAGELAGVINPVNAGISIKAPSYVRKDGRGMVRGYAEIERTTGNGGITSGTVFAIIGGGFRPRVGQTYTVPAVVIGTTSAFGIVTIAPSGNITFFGVGTLPASPQSFTVSFEYPTV